MRLVLARHGHTELNGQGVFQARLNPALAAEGVEEARCAAAELVSREIRWAAVYSSPLLRALQTAAILGDPHDVIKCGDLIERDLGVLDGRDRATYGRIDPQGMFRLINDREYYPPGGESRSSVYQRLTRALWHIFREQQGTQERPVLVVTHGGVLRELLHHSSSATALHPVATCHAVTVEVVADRDDTLAAAISNVDRSVVECARSPAMPPVAHLSVSTPTGLSTRMKERRP